MRANILVFICVVSVYYSAQAITVDDDGPQQSTTGPTPPQGVAEKFKMMIPAGEAVQLSVPPYYWRHGCGPTALGMVVGYFDTIGYDDLIPGDASYQSSAVYQAIASGGVSYNPNPQGLEEHYEDYSTPQDNYPNLLVDDYIAQGRTAHNDNSIADYMNTSKSTRNNYYGWSWSSDIGPSFVSYVNQQNSGYDPIYQEYRMASTLTWDVLTTEIDNNRPMVFLVDSDADGYADHFVTIVGYRDVPSQQYGCLDTWPPIDVVRWCGFEQMKSGQPWGIWGGWSFNLNCLPPSAPLNFSHNSIAADSITWTWQDNSNNEDGFRGQDLSNNIKWTALTDQTSYTESGLSVNTAYVRHIHAYNVCGDSSPGNSHSAYTAANPPGAASFSGITHSSIQANWTANGNPEGTEYLCQNITRQTDSGWTFNTYWDETGLDCETQYFYQVKAKNKDGVETTTVNLASQTTLNCPVPDISVSKISCDYNSICVGSSKDGILTIYNDGDANLSIVSFNGLEAADFNLAGPPTVPFIIKPNESNDLTVRFTPSSTGIKNAALSIFNDDPDENPTVVDLVGTGVASIIYVDINSLNDPGSGTSEDPYRRIQDGVNLAQPGCTVIVLQGTYTGDGNRDIDFLGKAITVRSSDPNDPNVVAATIIDCQGSETEPHRGFIFQSGEDANSILDGLTITNGYQSQGGAVYFGESSATIKRCVLRDNSADWGGAIYLDGLYSPVNFPCIIDCYIHGNSADRGGGVSGSDGGTRPIFVNCKITQNVASEYGGGVDFWYDANCVLLGCEISKNTAGVGGGGMYCGRDMRGKVDRCVITDNQASTGAGIMFKTALGPDLSNCVISGNQAEDAGGGIWWSDTLFEIKNSTITGNSALTGGGIYGFDGGSYSDELSLSNCIISGNTAANGAQIGLSVSILGQMDELNVIYCDVEEGYSGIYFIEPYIVNWGLGNIDIDPCFVDPGYWDANDTPADVNDDFWVEGDYHLRSVSACINSGDPNYTAEVNEVDMDGRPRVLYGRIDMGAYEYTEEMEADFDNDRIVNFKDFSIFASYWLEDCNQPDWCGGIDVDRSGKVGFYDLRCFADKWLSVIEEPNLIGYWKFDEHSGTVAEDSSGTGNDGVLINDPAWAEGLFGNGVIFAGPNDAVEIGTVGMDANSGSISMWVYPHGFPNEQHYLFGHTTQPPWSDRMQLYTDTSGNLHLGLGDSHATEVNIQRLNIQRWYHIALTWDGGSYVVYVDGTPKATGAYSGLTGIAAYADIGNNGYAVERDEPFKGIIDEVKIYNRVLSEAEIRELFLESPEELILDALDFAEDRLANTAGMIGTGEYSYYTESYTNWHTTGAAWQWWAAGFWPGSLWQMYEYNSDPNYKTWAQTWTSGLESQQYITETHDIGFIIFNSFAEGYRATSDPNYKGILLQAAENLADRYDTTVGCLKSFDWQYNFPIEVDNIPTLELLFWGSKNGGQSQWYDIAVDHAYKSAQELVRADGSTYHIIDFDPATGDVLGRYTRQGYAHESTWARGQAWTLYGFTMIFRETGDPNFLAVAKSVADYYVDNLPPDGVPYWDFNAPDIPNTDRDTSAAAIATAGLFELSTLASDWYHKQKYYNAALKALVSLCTIEPYGGYLGKDTNGNTTSAGVLKQGCLTHPDAFTPGDVVNENVIWGDYYFLEALLGYKAM